MRTMLKLSKISGFALLFILLYGTVHGAYGQRDLTFELNRLWKRYQPLFSRHCGLMAVEVRLLPIGAVVLSYNNSMPLVTASVTKLFTSAAALHYLGSDYRFVTDIRGTLPQGGKVPGSLKLYSYGNPLWSYKDMKACLSRMVDSYGVNTLEGRVIVDMSSFSPGIESFCIDNRCTMPYNPVISPVSLDLNTLKITAIPGKVGGLAKVVIEPPSRSLIVKNQVLTTGGNTGLCASFSGDGTVLVVRGRVSLRAKSGVSVEMNVPTPSKFIEGVVEGELANLGIRVLGKDLPAGDSVLVSCYGCPLSEAIRVMNTESNNFIAETVERLIGIKAYGPPGTSYKGVKAIEEYLYQIGVPQGDLHLTCGSGLNRANRATARAFGILLTRMYQSKDGQAFLDSLARNGGNGTLRRYWRNADFLVMAKTGTLKGTAGISGYVVWNRGVDPFAVTILCNDCRELWRVKRLMESFIRDMVQVFRESFRKSHSARAIAPIMGGNIRLDINRTPTT